MKFTVDYPVATPRYDPALVTAAGLTRVAQAAEECGYDAISFTEHPAPSQKWLDAGGHESLDQTSALAFCAAVTSRVRLMTYLTVLPYHNPFVAAKALSTVDLLSGGRLTVVAGTGYLRSEFLALNVDISQRNELFDESLEVMRGVWTGEPLTHQGKHFSARGAVSLPGPVQPGGPPVLIGGNSALARQRAARNQGWSPLMLSPEVARTSRTPGIATVAELAARIKEVRDAAARVNDGAAALTVQVHTPQAGFIQRCGSAEEHRDHLGQLADAGVDSFVMRPPGDSLDRTIESLHRYASAFLKALRPSCPRACYAVSVPRRDELQDAGRRQVLLVDPHPERGKGVLDRVDHGGRGDDHAALAHAAEVDIGVERDGLQVLDLDAGNVAGGGQQVVHEGGRLVVAAGVIG